jgi:hypothetical protein
VLFGTVTGRIVATIADRLGDPDALPDVVPVTGKVRFTPSVDAAISSTEGAIILPTPIEADLDEQGYISINGVRGASLIATDSPDLNPSGFTYTVSFIDLKFDKFPLAYKSFSMALPAGTTVDLSTVTPVKTSNGATIIRGAQGDPGPSAYEAWLSLGNTGTVYDFIVSLKGEPGGGGYVKPATGIPAADLASSVQTSLGKADSASQPGHTHTASQISDSTTTGRALITAADTSAARNTLAAAAAATTISPGTGLTGGGDLSANRTLALSAASVASLGKADTLTAALGNTARLGQAAQDITNADLNTIVNNGFYAGSTLTNAPNGDSSFYALLVQSHTTSGWTVQTATEYATPGGAPLSAVRTWRRVNLGGSWQSWTLIANNLGAVDQPARDSIATKAPIASPTFTGTVSGVTKAMVGLSNVDNTADTAKPVSTAQQTALNAKVDVSVASSSTVYSKNSSGALSGLGYSTVPAAGILPVRTSTGDITVNTSPSASTDAVSKAYADTKAPIASPTFTGTVSGITAAMTGSVANDGAILRVKQITQSAYTALATKDANTLYVIVG